MIQIFKNDCSVISLKYGWTKLKTIVDIVWSEMGGAKMSMMGSLSLWWRMTSFGFSATMFTRWMDYTEKVIIMIIISVIQVIMI